MSAYADQQIRFLEQSVKRLEGENEALKLRLTYIEGFLQEYTAGDFAPPDWPDEA